VADLRSAHGDCLRSLDRDVLEVLFAKRQAKASDAAGRKDSSSASAAVASPLDGQREKRIGIALQFLKLSIASIRRAVEDLDDEALSEDVIESLLSIFPTAEEEALVRDFASQHPAALKPNPVKPAATPVQFVAFCAADDRLQTRLRVWLCTIRFDRSVADVKSAANLVGYGSQRVHDSEALDALFAIALEAGNHLNAGSAALRDARGIALGDWVKLRNMVTAPRSAVDAAADSEANDHVATQLRRSAICKHLLGFVTLQLSEKFPEHYAQITAMGNVNGRTSLRRALTDACKVDPTVLSGEVRELTTHLEACRAFALAPPGVHDESLEPIRHFLGPAEEKLIALSDVVENATATVQGLGSLFVHPDGASCTAGGEVLSHLAALCEAVAEVRVPH
jgi:hypothetical protein